MKKTDNKLLLGLVFVVVFGISLGYAAISRTLTISGTSGIKNNSWDVHFETITVTQGSVSATKAATIEEGSTSVNYEIDLALPGDFYEFTVNVVNGGSVPAKLSATPTLSGVSAAQDVYVNYTVTYSDGTPIAANDELAQGATKTLKVRVEFDNKISAEQLPTSNQALNLGFSMDYIQK